MTSSRPVIGITCYVEPASRHGWPDVSSALVPHAYVAKVEAAGGVALVVPPRVDADEEVAEAVLRRLDGLIISGGADVDPERYAAARHPKSQAPRADRDTMELALATASRRMTMPTLGICRGMQVMAVADGGTLEQHVPDRVGTVDHSPGVAVYGQHPVTMVPGTVVCRLLGESCEVPSYHHQSVLTHPGYDAAAWAPDGTLEAIEDAREPFRIGVQWHPEVGDDLRLFAALVEAAARHT